MKGRIGLNSESGSVRSFPQVKICGFTSLDEAMACAEMGVDAVGCVFYPPSPRNLTEEQAVRICRSLPQTVCTVGVFVNESFSGIMRKVERCRLKAVQLHGSEPPEFVESLVSQGLIVIKGLYMNKEPSVHSAHLFKASAYLVECAGGSLPGGNAVAWDWGTAAGALQPPNARLIVAGGLNPQNVQEAIEKASPDAVDVSSGVEAAPGRKDLKKVKRFLQAVFQSECSREPRRIF